jgi:hypothetical protein
VVLLVFTVVKNIKETMLESNDLPTWGAPPTPTTREEGEEASMTGKNQEEAPSSPKRRQKWRYDCSLNWHLVFSVL